MDPSDGATRDDGKVATADATTTADSNDGHGEQALSLPEEGTGDSKIKESPSEAKDEPLQSAVPSEYAMGPPLHPKDTQTEIVAAKAPSEPTAVAMEEESITGKGSNTAEIEEPNVEEPTVKAEPTGYTVEGDGDEDEKAQGKKRPTPDSEQQVPSKRQKVLSSDRNIGEQAEANENDYKLVKTEGEGITQAVPDVKDVSDVPTSSTGALQPSTVERGYEWLGRFIPAQHEPPLPVGEGTGLVYDERMCEHFPLTDDTHPESPMRIKAIYNMLVERKLAQRCIRVPSREATKEEICSVHNESYRQVVQAIGKIEETPLQVMESMYDSIYMNKKSGMAARISAGSTVEIVKRVVNGELKNGVAVVRPPGHHAEAHAAKGFCFFNNVAVAAMIAVKTMGVKRVLVLDWDIHHGNGTQHMFKDDKRVLYFSVHRYDHGTFYPGSTDAGPKKVGGERAEGYNMNVAWNGGGMGDGDYIGMFHQLLLPVAYEFAPQLVLISAGFDSARGDPLGGCDISPAGFAHMTHSLMALAQGKVVLVLEGGYNLGAISHSFAACTATLLGDPPRMLGRIFPTKRATRAVKDTMRHHAPYWTCCSHTFEGSRFPLPQGTLTTGDDDDDEEEDEDYRGGEGDEDEDEEDSKEEASKEISHTSVGMES
mmetsp:Transcript_12437/g.30616  ORF Transcript_12437/g.30616 Transcript_12437/m.30616 type:complete len:653 (-) Transcript_12437:237-2195(-)